MMKMNKFLMIYLLFFLMGCSATINQIGGFKWYKDRMLEIETAHKDNKISEAEYISLKNQTEEIHRSWMNPHVQNNIKTVYDQNMNPVGKVF